MGEWRELQWQQHQQCGNGCDGGNSSGGSDDDSEGGDICEENWGGNGDAIKYPQRMASTKYSLSAKYASVLGRAITNGHSVRVRDRATSGNPRPKKISGQQLRSEPRGHGPEARVEHQLKIVLVKSGQTLEGNAASEPITRGYSHLGGEIGKQHTLVGCLQGVTQDHETS